LWVLLAALAVLGASCGRSGQAASDLRPELEFEHYTLANGLDVILRKDDRVPIASVNLWYSVGPANEVEGRRGFAHLFEHMMLQASGHRPGDYFSTLQAVGATGVNGSTDFDRTAFLQDVPSDQLELALWAESDRMGFLLDAVDLKTLRNQQDVIRNERRQNLDNAPYGLAREEVYRRLFPPEHPYHHFIYGSHADMQSAELDEIRDFFRRYYGPNNASLAVAGSIDIARTKAMIEKYFGSIPRGPEVPEVKVEIPQIEAEKRSVVTDTVELPAVYLAWVVDNDFAADAHGSLAARMLGGGQASRLYRDLVHDLQIAQGVNAELRTLTHGSVFQISATAKPGRTPAELEEAITGALDRMAKEGPGESELEAAKVSNLAITLKSLEPSDAVADRLNAYNHYFGDPGYLQKDLDRFRDTTPADVRQFVLRKLARDRRVVVHVNPGPKMLPPDPPTPPAPAGEAEPGRAAAEPWRNQVPRASKAPRVELPVPTTFELDNGLKVYLVSRPELPLVTAQLTARSGSAHDPPALPGLASFATEMLKMGAGGRSTLDIANRATAFGSTLQTGSSRESSFVVIQALKPNLDETVGLLADAVLRPDFPQAEIDRIRSERLAALRQQRSQPLTTAFKVMWREHFGELHPYGHLPIGTEQANEQIGRSDLVRAYRGAFVPKNSSLVLTGDLDEGEARALAEKAFGDWKGEAPAPAAPAAPTSSADRVLLVDRPGAPQTSLVLSQPGLARTDPDWSKLQLVNQVLGGLFSSRLNQNLREVHGVTYGVESEMTQGVQPGLIYVSMSVDRGQVAKSAGETVDELRRLKESGITEAELAEAREAVLRSLPSLFRTNGTTASTVARLYALGLPQDYYRRLESRLSKVTVDDAAAVATKYLSPDAVKVVAVGDGSVTEEQLASLGLGSVARRTADGGTPSS
jgi:zinc protease